MRSLHQIACVLFLAFGAFFAWQGFALHLDGQFGPGPGFFPFCIGIGIAILAVTRFAQVTLQPAQPLPEDFVPARERLVLLTVVVGALVGFMALLRPLGFDLAMGALLLVLFFAIDREHVVLKLVLAVVGSVGVHRVFEDTLKLPLPHAALPWLQSLGL